MQVTQKFKTVNFTVLSIDASALYLLSVAFTPKEVGPQSPWVINVDKNAAYPKAINKMKAPEELTLSVRLLQRKYLNNLVEQDHRFVKRLTKPGIGFHSFNTARSFCNITFIGAAWYFFYQHNALLRA